MASGSHDAQGLLWGAEPEGWASHEPNHSPLFRAMIDATDIGAGSTVLDIGCGAGTSCALIKATGASVIGVDAASGMIDYAAKTFDGIDFRVGGMEELAFGDDEFDVVFAANSVPYAADIDTAFGELKRVCKPGGAIVTSLFGPPAGVSYKPVFEALGQFMPQPPEGAKPGGPFRLASPGKLEERFAAAGISVSGRGEVNCPFLYRSWSDFWQVTRSAGPTQMAISLSSHDAVEEAVHDATAQFTAEDGTVTFDPNMFVYVFGKA